MFHDWDLTQEEFDRLLAWLHPNREEAAIKYEEIRRRLRKTLVARGCDAAAEIFDEAIYRVARKLPDLLLSYEGDPALYFYAVANLIHLEYRRHKVETEPISDSTPIPNAENVEENYQCLEQCLNDLPAEDKDLLMRFYRGDKQDKIIGRKNLAQEFGLTENALRLRLFRLRQKLALCIENCRTKQKY